MTKSKKISAFILLIVFFNSVHLFFSCKKEKENPITKDNTEISRDHLLGGNLTIFDNSVNAFGFPAPELEGMNELNFFVGNSFFNQGWVTAPASTTARDGLGPFFNATSCSGCHFKDGRGRPPLNDGEFSTGFLIRLSIPGKDPNGGPMGHPVYGGQLSDKAINGIKEEGSVSITYTSISGTYSDGTKYELQKPNYRLVNLNYGDPGANLMMSPRIGQQMIGLGLLEAISEQTILSLADPNDVNNDGISGRPNYVWDAQKKTKQIGRFGWKANQPNLFQQSAGAYLGDLGITTHLFPYENCSDSQKDCLDSPNGGTPEISKENMEAVELYVSHLAVPAQRNHNSSKIIEGKQTFVDIGCEKCHLTKIKTSIHPKFPALSNQTIRPYTDLLLHDMGPDLADGRPDFEANGNEWRTPPLWGIGLIKTVNNHTFFLHDGRARNLEEAILWHGGEAKASQQNFLQLTKEKRKNLIKFLNSL